MKGRKFCDFVIKKGYQYNERIYEKDDTKLWNNRTYAVL